MRWHLIGGLQSNKAKAVVGAFSLIHSVDRVSLAKALDRAARERQIVQSVLLQVKLGNETTKSGCAPDELEALARECVSMPNLAVCGLMTLPPFNPNPEAARPHFKHLRQLRDRLSRERVFTASARRMSTHVAPATWHLSMGMSNDFEIAIEEGATIIRVGTGLFGSRLAAQAAEELQQPEDS